MVTPKDGSRGVAIEIFEGSRREAMRKTSFYLLLPRLVLVRDDFGLVYDPLPRGVLRAVAGYEQKETRRQINMQHLRHPYL